MYVALSDAANTNIHTHTHTCSLHPTMLLSWCRFFFVVESQETGKFEFFSSFSFSGELISLSLAITFSSYALPQIHAMYEREKASHLHQLLAADPYHASPPAPAYTVISFWFRIPTLYLSIINVLNGKAFGFWNKINQFAALMWMS